MILKSFDFQCDFDFQINTSKMILILNHLYLGDLISILKSSICDDFAHLWFWLLIHKILPSTLNCLQMLIF